MSLHHWNNCSPHTPKMQAKAMCTALRRACFSDMKFCSHTDLRSDDGHAGFCHHFFYRSEIVKDLFKTPLPDWILSGALDINTRKWMHAYVLYLGFLELLADWIMNVCITLFFCLKNYLHLWAGIQHQDASVREDKIAHSYKLFSITLSF